ncbi:LexA family protein [Aneurinibacillus sp. Ricciae_BoGa-3]|uniref:LexA family protein n=1 Tax=Aneurinibacillus sp. Ricciae_BoGa-3 TaxID=3022697 RepID=UPI003FA40A76
MREILAIVKRLLKEKGYPPTIRENATVPGLTSTTVHGYLDRLQRRCFEFCRNDLPR